MEKEEKNVCCLKFLVQAEMVAVEKQLEASQRFLGGVRALASYEDIEQKQLRGLLIALGKSKELSTTQAASLVEAIDARLWSESSVEELQRQVAAKTSQVEGEGERRRMQDFSHIVHFLPQELATMILEGKGTADAILRALCLHAGLLSLRVPSEYTIATFVTLANWKQFCDGMTDKEKYVLLQRQKHFVRKCLSAMDDVTNPLPALPMEFGQLPAHLRDAAFGGSLPVNMAENGVAMMQAARTMPMRGTNRSLSSAASTGRAKEDMTADWTTRAITAAVQGAVAASHSLLAHGGAAATASSATTGLPSAAMEVRPPPLLALTNAPHAEMAAKELMPDVDTSTGRVAAAQVSSQDGDEGAQHLRDVESQLATLRAVAPKATAKGKAKSLCKRPATKASLRKRPAAAMAPKGCSDRKASAAAKGKSSGKTSTGCPMSAKAKAKRTDPKAATVTLSRQARRQAILAVVPKKVQLQFQNGCSKCRYTNCTVSCWRSRGFVAP